MIGKQLDEYMLKTMLGRGSVGDLYEAWQPAGENVAIKLVDPQLASHPDFAGQFVQTAELVQQRLADRPGICPILQVRHTPDALYLVLPYFPDGSLEAYRQKLAPDEENKTRLAPEQVANVGIRVANLLAQLPDAGLKAHGGLHPYNILLQLTPVDDDTAEADLLLTDVGLTHLVRQTTAADVKPYRGPMPYTPPLLAEAGGPVPDADERMDVYALGNLLYLLLEGHHYAPELEESTTDTRPPTKFPLSAPAENFDPKHALESLILEAIAVYDSESDRLTPAVMAQDLEAIIAAAGWPKTLHLPFRDIGSADKQPRERPFVAPTRTAKPAKARVARIEITCCPPGNGHGPTVTTDFYDVQADQQFITLGRGPDRDIILTEDNTIRSHHLDVQHVDGEWSLISHVEGDSCRLEGKLLSPGTPQLWYEGQRLSLGRYTLRLLDVAAAHRPQNQFRVDLLPAIQEISPGFQGKVGISIHNRGERSHFRVVVGDELPQGYYSLLQDGIVLGRGDRRDLTLKLHPPLNAPGQDFRYTVTAERLGDKPGETKLEPKAGVLRVRPTTPFALHLVTDDKENNGRYRLLIQNRGNQPARYHFNARNANNALEFGLAATEQRAVELAAPAETPAPSPIPARHNGQTRQTWSMLSRLPLIGPRLRQLGPLRQARQGQQQVRQVQRQAGRFGRLRGVWQRNRHSSPTATAETARPPAVRFDGAWQHSITLNGGEEATLRLWVRPRRRSLRWQPLQEYPFTVTVTPHSPTPTETGPQTKTAVLHATSYLGQATWLLLLGLLLLLSLTGAIVVGFQGSQVVREMRQAVAAGRANALADWDGDGLPNLEEVLIYGTDPLKWDTDGDGLSDGVEVHVQGISPLQKDTAGDRRPDPETEGLATATPTPPGNIFVAPAPPQPTATPLPTVTPTPIPTVSPPLVSAAITIPSLPEGDTAVILLGDSADNQQLTHTLAFDTSILPPGSEITDAWLLLVLADDASLTVLENGALGTIYVTAESDLRSSPHALRRSGDEDAFPADFSPPTIFPIRHGTENLVVAQLSPEVINVGDFTRFTLTFELASNLDNRADQVRFWSSKPPPNEHPPLLRLTYWPAAEE
jgi:hypothetical protein